MVCKTTTRVTFRFLDHFPWYECTAFRFCLLNEYFLVDFDLSMSMQCIIYLRKCPKLGKACVITFTKKVDAQIPVTENQRWSYFPYISQNDWNERIISYFKTANSGSLAPCPLVLSRGSNHSLERIIKVLCASICALERVGRVPTNSTVFNQRKK